MTDCNNALMKGSWNTKFDEIINYSEKKILFESENPFYGWKYNGSMVIVQVISNSKDFRKYKRIKKRQLRKNK